MGGTYAGHVLPDHRRNDLCKVQVCGLWEGTSAVTNSSLRFGPLRCCVLPSTPQWVRRFFLFASTEFAEANVHWHRQQQELLLEQTGTSLYLLLVVMRFLSQLV